MTTLTFLLERSETPIGHMLLATDEAGRLRILDWLEYENDMRQLLRRQYPGMSVRLENTGQTSSAMQAVMRYFDGDLAAIDTIEVATGGTPFQREVWAALRTIAHGSSLSYLGLAARIGRPTAVRAVGMANGANPVSIVVPCHRVIGSNATLTGYGGGLHRKRWLLEHEKALPGRQHDQQTELPGF